MQNRPTPKPKACNMPNLILKCISIVFNIYSTLPNDNYGYESGTSSAAALVSGEAALLLTVVTDNNGNGYINDEVRHVIESTCDELEIAGLGKGRINIDC